MHGIWRTIYVLLHNMLKAMINPESYILNASLKKLYMVGKH